MAKDIEEKGRQVPSPAEKTATKKSFTGNERTTKWSIKQVTEGQFIQFTYNKKLRRVLVLTPGYVDPRSTKQNSVLACIDLSDIAYKPNQLNKLFNKGALPRLLITAIQTGDGFRFFQVAPTAGLDKIVQKNKLFQKHYKTFLMSKLKTGVIQMYNPIFSEAMMTKMNVQDIQ